MKTVVSESETSVTYLFEHETFSRTVVYEKQNVQSYNINAVAEIEHDKWIEWLAE